MNRSLVVFSSVVLGLYLLVSMLADAQPTQLYGMDRASLPIKTIEKALLQDVSRNKELQIRLTYPDAPGPFPVIIWSHGATATKDMYQPLIEYWAAMGYVCLQPNHSDSRDFGQRVPRDPTNLLDWENRPRDIVFLMDSLDQLEAQYPAVTGKLDHSVVGVGGHSFGAHTAQLIAGATTNLGGQRQSHSDPRPLAFLLMSPQGIGEGSAGLDETSWQGVTRPFLLITGTKDLGRTGVGWEWRLDPYKYSPIEDKYLLVIEDAYHGFGGVVGEADFPNTGPSNLEQVRYVQSASLAFWDSYLKHNLEAGQFLSSDALERYSDSKATLTTKSRGPVATTPASPKPEAGLAVSFEDRLWHDEARNRDVPVRIYAPALAVGEGPFPAVVFSHGGGESREAFGYLGNYWAAKGYLVVFLTHLGNDRSVVEAQGMNALGNSSSAQSRPQDLRFALDMLLSDNSGSRLLAERVDSERIAVAGQCAGSTTALSLVGLLIKTDLGEILNTDPRVSCAIALSPQMAADSLASQLFHLGEDSWSNIQTPTLVMTGSQDFNWLAAVRKNPALTRMAYDSMPPGDKYLVEMQGAEHNAFTDSVPYYPARERDPRHHQWIQQATTAFLDAYLRQDELALEWLQSKSLEAATQGECHQEHKPDTGPDAKNVLPPSKAPAASSTAAEETATWLIQLFDRTGDGALSLLETPQRLKQVFNRIDSDGKGALSLEELASALEKYQQAGMALQPKPATTQLAPPSPAQPAEEAATSGSAGFYTVGVVESLALQDAKRDKELQLRITYPADTEQCPVLLFSHCVGGKRDDFGSLVQHWASQGYVVIQMDHADTQNLNEDWRNRARDVSFVLDSLDELCLKAPELAGKLQASRLGVCGHLIGAYASCALVGMQSFAPDGTPAPDPCGDPRVDAALLLSPQGRGQGLTENSWEGIDKPMLVAAGSATASARTSNPAEWRAEPYLFAKPGDKYLFWVEGMDNSYAGLCRGGVEEEPAELIKAVTTAFFDAYLKGDTQARDRLCAWPISAADKTRFRLESKSVED